MKTYIVDHTDICVAGPHTDRGYRRFRTRIGARLALWRKRRTGDLAITYRLPRHW